MTIVPAPQLDVLQQMAKQPWPAQINWPWQRCLGSVTKLRHRRGLLLEQSSLSDQEASVRSEANSSSTLILGALHSAIRCAVCTRLVIPDLNRSELQYKFAALSKAYENSRTSLSSAFLHWTVFDFIFLISVASDEDLLLYVIRWSLVMLIYSNFSVLF